MIRTVVSSATALAIATVAAHATDPEVSERWYLVQSALHHAEDTIAGCDRAEDAGFVHDRGGSRVYFAICYPEGEGELPFRIYFTDRQVLDDLGDLREDEVSEICSATVILTWPYILHADPVERQMNVEITEGTGRFSLFEVVRGPYGNFRLDVDCSVDRYRRVTDFGGTIAPCRAGQC